MREILVTGATGKIGSSLISRLAREKGILCRAFVRNEAKARQMLPENVIVYPGEFEDEEKVYEAVAGVDTIVLITPANKLAVEQARTVLNAAIRAGVRKIVRVSVFKAAVDGPTAITRLHGKTDEEIMNSELTYTILRPGFFMQNLLFLATRSIEMENRFYFGTGEGKLGMIDYRDIVDCIEQVVITNRFDNEIFTLTGPESISFSEVARRLSDILGRLIQYVPVSLGVVEHSIKSKGLGEWYAGVMRELCDVYNKNWGNVVTGHVLYLAGHAPRSFNQFAHEIFIPALEKNAVLL